MMPLKKVLKTRIFWGSTSTAIVLIAIIALGVFLREPVAAQDDEIVTTTTQTSSTTTTTTLPPKFIQPVPANLPLLAEGESIGPGSNNPNISLYEQRLSDLKIDPGPIDNKYDQKTVYAIHAVQKLKGLERNGRINNDVIKALNEFQYDEPLIKDGEANRMEVNIENQVGIYYHDHQVRLITSVSTGRGGPYSYVSKSTGRRVNSVANTPTGRFEFQRQINGWRDADLGMLYKPIYFKGGIAVHGYKSIPTTAASSGCVRIPMHVAEYFLDIASIGDAIYVIANRDIPYVADRVGPVVTTVPPIETEQTTTTVKSTTTKPATTTTTPSTSTTTTTEAPTP